MREACYNIPTLQSIKVVPTTNLHGVFRGALSCNQIVKNACLNKVPNLQKIPSQHLAGTAVRKQNAEEQAYTKCIIPQESPKEQIDNSRYQNSVEMQDSTGRRIFGPKILESKCQSFKIKNKNNPPESGQYIVLAGKC